MKGRPGGVNATLRKQTSLFFLTFTLERDINIIISCLLSVNDDDYDDDE